jgi:hypothetical protein
VIETPEKIQEAIGIIEGMMRDGLIVTSDVDMIRLVHEISLSDEGTNGTNLSS